MASGADLRSVHRRLPAGIWTLGFVSLFMDTSSELVHSLLPVFMSTVLGASMVTIGVIEGVAEATASITRIFSGALSDWLGRRKLLVFCGYGLAALTKPVFPLAASIGWVFGARFADRIGKGIRGAPRDALVADITPPELRGAAYGLRQAMDSVGAVAGPLLAVLLMAWLADDIRGALWVAVLPAFVSVGLIAFVREPGPQAGGSKSRRSAMFRGVREMPARYWWIVVLGALFTLARFSEAFLVLRAQDVGMAIRYVPAVMIVMNVVYALGAYPAGLAADRLSARGLLIAGLVVLILSDVLLARATGAAWVFAGTACWGLHLAFTQGLMSKLVADVAPAALRGTAFGVFNLTSGAALLGASAIAGLLWSAAGPSATFLAGAGFAALAGAGVLALREARA